MFFRFGCAIVLVVLISLTGTTLEKRNLELRRSAARQHFRMQALLEQHATLRVVAQELGAPHRLVATLDLDAPEPSAKSTPAPKAPRKPKKRQKPRS